jgi:Ca2+-binding RTX toxin-like protein
MDAITDFSVPADTIRLENSVFTTIGANGALAAAAFQSGSGGGAATAAVRIIYNSASGKLFYDSDGNGAAVAVHFATLSTGLALTNADFLVI